MINFMIFNMEQFQKTDTYELYIKQRSFIILAGAVQILVLVLDIL